MSLTSTYEEDQTLLRGQWGRSRQRCLLWSLTPESDTQNSCDQRQTNCWLLQVTLWVLHTCNGIHIHGYLSSHTYIQTQREIKFLKLKGKKLNWILQKISPVFKKYSRLLVIFPPTFSFSFNNLFLFDRAFYFNPDYIKL